MAVTSSQAVDTSDYHAKFHAQVLSLRHTGDSTDKLAFSLADAVVDLNPHQIDAEKHVLLDKVMARLETQSTEEPLFMIRWRLEP